MFQFLPTTILFSYFKIL